MIERLVEHLAILEDDGNSVEIQQHGLAVTLRIIKQVAPSEVPDVDLSTYWQWAVRGAIQRTLGLLEHQVEIQRYLRSDGPETRVDYLHPVIRDAARDLWRNGHFGDAVRRAALFLNADIQDRSTRPDLSDKDLMNQVFTTDAPKPDKPRLWWVQRASAQTTRSMREGIHHYALGVSLAIRNRAAHDTAPLTEQMALEQLASLSVLARWLDESALHTGNPKKEGTDTAPPSV